MLTVILNGSPRKNGNTVTLINLLKRYINGDIKIINTFFENVSPCSDCRKCYTLNKCVIDDSMSLLYNDIIKADNILMASPLYYSMLTSSLLSFASRFQYFFVSKNIRKDPDLFIKKKKGFLILTGGGATKDCSHAQKVSEFIFKQINASLIDTFKYIKTDTISLENFNNLPLKTQNYFLDTLKTFAKNFY